LVGFRAGVYTKLFDVDGFVVNGWETNDDPDQEKTLGAHASVRLLDMGKWNVLTFTPSVIWGHEPTSRTAGDRRCVCDLITVVQPIEAVKVAFEANFGNEDDPIERAPLSGGGPVSAGRETWEGYLGVVNVRLTKWFAFTL